MVVGSQTIVSREDVFIVPEGEVYEGDIVVMGGVLLIKGTVKGSVASLRGKVKITGHIEGSFASIYSKVVLSGHVDNVATVYTNLVVDGGTYGSVAIVASWGDVLRPSRVRSVAIKNDPITTAFLGLLLGYSLAFL